MAENTNRANTNGKMPNEPLAPTSMDELDNLRRQIDAIDRQMAHLFEERMHVSLSIGSWKKAAGKAIRDEKREQEMLVSHCQWLTDASLRDSYCTFLQTLMKLSCALQNKENEKGSA